MALIRKESLDKFIQSMVGAPVIINHKDLTKNNVDSLRVGVITRVWFDEKDGWYWCEGVIWDETAINLIQDEGWSVSCSYDVKLADDAGGTENNVPYDIEFLDGVFTHLAIVYNPRYERANIVFNSKTVINNQFKEEEHPRDKNGQFTSGENGVNPNYKTELKQVIDKAKNNPTEHQKLVIGKVAKDLEEKAKDNGFDISGYQHDLDVSGTRHAIKEHGQPKTEEPRGQIAITDEDFEKIPDVIYGYDEVSFTGKNKIGRETITYKKAFDDGTILYVEEIRDKRKTLTINTLYKQKNTGNPRTFVENNNPLSNASLYIITNSSQDLNPDYRNIKENELLNDLKSLVSSIENDKWITIHPNGKDSKGRPLLLKDGETPEEAIERTYGNKQQKVKRNELQQKEYERLKDKIDAIKLASDSLKKDAQYFTSRDANEIYKKVDKLFRNHIIPSNLSDDDYKEISSIMADLEDFVIDKNTKQEWGTGQNKLKAIQKQLEEQAKKELEIKKQRLDNNKEQEMTLLEELKKLITKVENGKGENMDDEKKIENEKVDKRKLIDEIGGILKGKVDEELWRTIIGKAEKIAYEKSEAGTADNSEQNPKKEEKPADNQKIKNEDEESKEEVKELKKEMKEDAENKKSCKNSVDNAKGGFFDKLNEVYNSAMKIKEESLYVSRQSKLDAANEYFAK